jgi:hypothetical protein
MRAVPAIRVRLTPDRRLLARVTLLRGRVIRGKVIRDRLLGDRVIQDRVIRDRLIRGRVTLGRDMGARLDLLTPIRGRRPPDTWRTG